MSDGFTAESGGAPEYVRLLFFFLNPPIKQPYKTYFVLYCQPAYHIVQSRLMELVWSDSEPSLRSNRIIHLILLFSHDYSFLHVNNKR